MAKTFKYKALWTLGLSVVAMGLSGVALADSSHSSDQIQINNHNTVVQATLGQTSVSVGTEQTGVDTDGSVSDTANGTTHASTDTDSSHVSSSDVTDTGSDNTMTSSGSSDPANPTNLTTAPGAAPHADSNAIQTEVVTSKPRISVIYSGANSLLAGLAANQNQPMTGLPMTPPVPTPHSTPSQPLPFDLPSLPGTILQHISSLLSTNLLSRVHTFFAGTPIAHRGIDDLTRLLTVAILVATVGSLFVTLLRASGYAMAARGVPTGFEFATLPSVSFVNAPFGASASSLFGGISLREFVQTDYRASRAVVSGVRNKGSKNPIRKGVTEQ